MPDAGKRNMGQIAYGAAQYIKIGQPALERTARSTDTLHMPAEHYLTNQFLIAMPAMADGNFSQTVTLVCEHTAQGALGIVINRPMQMRLADVFEQLHLSTQDQPLREQLILQGGPVQPDRGFVIHRAGQPWESTLAVSEHIHVTTSRDILTALAEGRGPEPLSMALGYAGWEAGQLEAEMAQNAWLNVPFNERILFDTPFEQRWQAAAQLLGINLNTLSSQAGHA
ncbi:MAG: YqgE/AlgH family protein [Steroidobacteraceae bacterium]